MVLALLVSRDVVVGVPPVPAELVLLVGGNVHVLEISVGLLAVAAAAVVAVAVLRVGERRAQRNAGA